MNKNNKFVFKNLEKEYECIKRIMADLLGFGIDQDGFLYDQDTFEIVKFKNKFINIYIESDEYFNVVSMSLMNSHMFSLLFKRFLKELEEEDKYVKSFFEEYGKMDENGVQPTRLVVNSGNGFQYFTDWYYIPGLKFIAMMAILSSDTVDLFPERKIKEYDKYSLPYEYNKRAIEYTEYLSKCRKKLERKFYEFT